MVARYSELATLAEEERRALMLAMARAEYELTDDQLHAFTKSRLGSWLELAPETAQCVASSYDAVMLKMPGPQAMRRVSVVQTLAREFPVEDQDRLASLLPGVFAGAGIGVHMPPIHDASAPTASAKKGWWPFGRR
jgi:hypothetical protein